MKNGATDATMTDAEIEAAVYRARDEGKSFSGRYEVIELAAALRAAREERDAALQERDDARGDARRAAHRAEELYRQVSGAVRGSAWAERLARDAMREGLAECERLRAAAHVLAGWAWAVCDQTIACPACGVAWWGTDAEAADDWHAPGCEFYAALVAVGLGSGRPGARGVQAFGPEWPRPLRPELLAFARALERWLVQHGDDSSGAAVADLLDGAEDAFAAFCDAVDDGDVRRITPLRRAAILNEAAALTFLVMRVARWCEVFDVPEPPPREGA